jgi:PAS domain S-box-containing protein
MEQKIKKEKRMEEDYLEKAFASLHIQIAYLDAEFNFVRVNDAYAKGAGHEPDYFVGKNHFDLFPHEENEKIFRKVVEAGEPHTTFAKPFEYPDQPGRGVTYWDWNLQPIKNDKGKVEGLLLSLIDVTEKEKTLRDYARLATAIENATEGILIFDQERKILYVNPSFLKASGFAKKDLLGKKTYLLRSDLYDEQFHDEITDVISRGKVWKGPYRRQRKDKTYYDVEMTIFPLLDSTGNASEFVIVERDVTDELKLQQRIRQIQKMEALGTLAAGVAHDFNNILLPIIVNTELALRDVSKDSSAQEYLKLSLEAAERGRELVKQIIAFSRPSSQEIKPIKIGPIVEEAIHLLKSTLPSNIKITLRIGDLSGFVLADPNQIHQVLLNLFSNAVHAMRENGGELRVELDNVLLDEQEMEKYPELKSEKCLKLMVSDTGNGISEKNIEKIFDPFFTTKSRGEGSGMGLSVVHGIIKSCGGGIETHSEEGIGTTFDIYIPLIKDQKMEKSIREKEIPRGSEHILLVDDEEFALKSLESVLKHLGYEVTGKKNAKEALITFNARSDTFDLVITDQIMPELSGLELSQKILEIRPDMLILICTGFSDKINKKKVKEIGIREVVLKPLKMSEIAQVVRRVLDKRAEKI